VTDTSFDLPRRLRSLLFAPAVRPDFLKKLPGRGADGIVIDCEDATPPGAKAEGRANAVDWAPTMAEGPSMVFTRINPPGTEWFDEDVAAGLHPSLSGVIVPMVESVAGLDAVGVALDAAGHTGLGILAGIETALGVADARPLLAHPRVIAAYFGAEDFIADMGGVRTESNEEVLVARSVVALAGRLARVTTLDQVVTDFANDARFVSEVTSARNMGFGGKLCIHPQQVPLANAAFVPTAAEVDRAERLLAAYAEASEAGIAAIAFEGQMVDEPLANQARQILAAHSSETDPEETP